MPRPKVHVVSLTVQDRATLKKIISSGSPPAMMITRARILLALDQAHTSVADRRLIAERLETSEGTVYRVAKQYTGCGGHIDQVVARKKRVTAPVEPKVTGDVEARILALAQTQPPEGRTRWTLRLLEKHVLVTEGIPALDHSTIAKVLKKGGFSLI